MSAGAFYSPLDLAILDLSEQRDAKSASLRDYAARMKARGHQAAASKASREAAQHSHRAYLLRAQVQQQSQIIE